MSLSFSPENTIVYLLYFEIFVAFCCLCFIVLCSQKWAGEKTTQQKLPIIGLILMMVAGVCDGILDALTKLEPSQSILTQSFSAFCRIFIQNQIFVLVWLSTQYIQLEILIGAPNLLKRPEYISMSNPEKQEVIRTKGRLWVAFSFSVCLIYYMLRIFFITMINIDCQSHGTQ